MIAIVDDDASVRQALSSLLRSAGYRARLFDSSHAFLQNSEVGEFACVILDVHMPGANGLDLQRRICELKPGPVIFMSAHSEQDLRERAFRQGAVAFLRKPFSEKVLLDAVWSAVRARHDLK